MPREEKTACLIEPDSNTRRKNPYHMSNPEQSRPHITHFSSQLTFTLNYTKYYYFACLLLLPSANRTSRSFVLCQTRYLCTAVSSSIGYQLSRRPPPSAPPLARMQVRSREAKPASLLSLSLSLAISYLSPMLSDSQGIPNPYKNRPSLSPRQTPAKIKKDLPQKMTPPAKKGTVPRHA